jgi:hypothetical protein
MFGPILNELEEKIKRNEEEAYRSQFWNQDVASFYDFGDLDEGSMYRKLVSKTPTSSTYKGIDPTAYRDDKKQGAQRLYADVIKAQQQDYMTRFAPIENMLASEITATGTKSLGADMARTRAAITGAAKNYQGQANRAQQRYGLTNTQQVANSNETVSAMVGGMNDTRLRDSSRRLELLGGGMSGIATKARTKGA